MEYIKNFEEWNTKKQSIEKSSFSPAYFSEGEVWWLSIGINIGYEEDGKSRVFSRPVLIVKKFNRNLFLGIPLSTKVKDSPYYIPILFRGRPMAVMISQLRAFSSKRLLEKMGKLENIYYQDIVFCTKNLFVKSSKA